jgi:type VI secretion system protein ImpJ
MTSRVSDKVAWSEGVLLQPQHFQQLDRYHESLLTTRLDAIHPLSWGVLSIVLDARALQQGSVALVSFEGVLPDGTPLALGGQTGRVPNQRPVQGHFPASQRTLTVYLALPNERPRVNNYGTEGNSLRYAVNPAKVFDTSRDDAETDVNCAIPNVSLLFADESRDGFTALPIASIVRDAHGELSLSDTFVPPCLRIGASSVIGTRLDRLLRTMIGRLRLLSEARRRTGEGRVEFNAADVTSYLQLSALNGMLPKIHYLARAKHVSPLTAFLLLSELAGQLATFSPDTDMTVPLDFDYADQETTFKQLFDLNDRLLSVSDTERFVSCTLQTSGDSRHYAELHDVRMDQCVLFFIGVESNLPRPQVVDEFVRRAKVASHGDMDFVLNKNIGGVNVVESQRPPAELPVRPGLVYFELPAADSDVYWKHVRQDRNLVVWLPPVLDQSQPVVKLLGLFGSR